MNIDRVAKAMTEVRGRGPSGPAFTARVMAPIDGRPSPGFTSRVMRGLDAPVAQGFSAATWVAQAFRPALLIPAAIALAAGAVILARSTVRMPATPGAPRLATNAAGVRIPEASVPAPVATPSRAASGPAMMLADSPTAPLPEPSPIYQIAALEGPAQITAKDIQPAACTIPALEGPAPLKVTDLPANAGGSNKEFKEQP